MKYYEMMGTGGGLPNTRQHKTLPEKALSLPLSERVKLRNELTASIETEVAALKAAADEAVKIAGE